MTSVAEQKAYKEGFFEPERILEARKEKNRLRALKAWRTMRERNKLPKHVKLSKLRISKRISKKQKNRLRALKAWRTIRKNRRK
jgi:hypothetical protein